MSEGTAIVAFVVVGLVIGWIMYGRISRRLTAVMTRLAVEKDGVVEPGTFLRLPKLILSYGAKRLEVSVASSGESGGSSAYTYVIVRDVEAAGFEFRILPTSTQTVIDNALGLARKVATGNQKFDEYFSVYTNDQHSIGAVLTEPVQWEILGWVEKNRNLIQDISYHDNRFMFCVDGTLSDHADFLRLIDGACLLYDAVRGVSELKTSTSPSGPG